MRQNYLDPQANLLQSHATIGFSTSIANLVYHNTENSNERGIAKKQPQC